MLVSWFAVRNCNNYNELLRNVRPFKSIVLLSIWALTKKWRLPYAMELFFGKHSWFPLKWKSAPQCTAYSLYATSCLLHFLVECFLGGFFGVFWLLFFLWEWMLFLLFVWGLFGGSVGVVFTLKALVLVIMQYLASCITAKFKKN